MDICKWKPMDKLSIDFAFFRKNGEVILKSSKGDRLVEFIGTKRFPFNRNMIDKQTTIITEIMYFKYFFIRTPPLTSNIR